MERVQPPQQAHDESTREPLPAERDPARLPQLIAEAQSAQGGERLKLARQVNELLIAMRSPGNEAAEAQAILKALELKALEGLVDSKDRSCRAEAVETLIACGFPHALEIAPEDLAHHVEDRKRVGPAPLVLGVSILGASVLWLAYAAPGAVPYLEPVLYGLGGGLALLRLIFRALKENPKKDP